MHTENQLDDLLELAELGDIHGEQELIRLPLPLVEGHKEYREREALLIRLDELLVQSGVEDAFIEHHLNLVDNADGASLSDRRRASVSLHARRTLRCMIALLLSETSNRDFSNYLAESSLLQWFCHYNMLTGVKPPSKSTLQRMRISTDGAAINKIMHDLVLYTQEVDETGESALRFAESIDLSCVWIDTTCAALDIHFPTDWVLLRDGVRSIMHTIATIRSHGLLHRMPDPASIVRAINGLSMTMGKASRRGRGPEKKKGRKATLRAMKKVVHKAIRHADRYRIKLRESWEDLDLSHAQMEQLARRLDDLIDLMPKAIEQAHERIIGERPVANANKILSLSQPHAKVYVRGKAGAEAEFGLQLLLAESVDGLILDCTLTPDAVANDTTLLLPAVKRICEAYGADTVSACVTDRGFTSADNSAELEKLGIADYTFPRSLTASADRLKDKDDQFAVLQKRRAQTEARIGIFKARFLGNRIPARSEKAQAQHVAWSALVHNLWVLARMETVADPEPAESQEPRSELAAPVTA